MRKTIRQSSGIPAALIIIAVTLACGPAALPEQSSEDLSAQPKTGETKTPAPTLDPTKEKEIEDKLKTAVYQTPTPKPAGDGQDKATTTPEPTEPPPQPPTAVPTTPPYVVPTPTTSPYVNITIDEDFCFNVSLYDPQYYRARDKYNAISYIQVECTELVGQVISERCFSDDASTFTTESKVCITRNAALVKDYRLRSTTYHQCFTDDINNDEQFFQCARETGDADHALRLAVDAMRWSIRTAADKDPRVMEAEQNARDCLEATEGKPDVSEYVDTTRLLFWQSWNTEEEASQLAKLGESRLEKVRQYMLAVDKCVLKAGVYRERYNFMMTELRRYAAEDATKLAPWKKFGILSALEEYGSEMLRP